MLSFFLEITDNKHFFYSFVPFVSISVQCRKCLFFLLMAAEKKKKVWWNASVCTGIVYVLISIQNVSLSLFFITAQTTAAVLSWFVADSYWNISLYYGISKFQKHWDWIPELLEWDRWNGDRKTVDVSVNTVRTMFWLILSEYALEFL